MGAVVHRQIEMEENRRVQQEGLQSIQDGSWMEEVGAAGGSLFESPNKWHGDLSNAWETNSPTQMEEAIAGNLEALESERMLGMAQLMLQSLI